MGLDMYLEARFYLSEYNPDRKPFRDKANELFAPLRGDMMVKQIICEAAYWRKANHIHKWFVDNVQDGEDNCQEYYVHHEQIKELIDLCKKIGKSKKRAAELLPTQSGFFFGSTEYDQYYFSDLRDTIKQLTPLLDEKFSGWSFYYTSSW